MVMQRRRDRRMNSRTSIKIVSLATALVFLWTTISWSQEMAVPVKVQFPLFLKILVFDRNLKERVGNEIVVGIVYQRKFKRSLKTRDEFVDVMKKSPIKKVEDIPIRQVSIDVDEVDLDSAVSKNKVDILYIAPVRALEMEKITNLSRDKKILTLTGVPDYVDSGLTVGIGTKGRKPRIIINLPAAKAEGVDFSSGLLNLAKVVKK